MRNEHVYSRRADPYRAVSTEGARTPPAFMRARVGLRFRLVSPEGGDEVWLHSAQKVGEGREQLVRGPLHALRSSASPAARSAAFARLRATSGRAATALATRLRSGFHLSASLSRKAMAVLTKVFPARAPLRVRRQRANRRSGSCCRKGSPRCGRLFEKVCPARECCLLGDLSP